MGMEIGQGEGQFWGEFGASHCNQWGLCCIVVMGASTGKQGGKRPLWKKVNMGMAHPANFSRGLKTSWQ